MPAPRKSPLSRARIVKTAIALARSEGLAAISMRRLATRLGVEAMSLYNHVASKDDLLNAMVAATLARVPAPDPSAPWRTRLKALIEGFYTTLVENPWLVLVLAREEVRYADARGVALLESAVGALADAGLPPVRIVNAFRGGVALCLGFALAHTRGLSSTRAEADAIWATWTPDEWERAGAQRLLTIAPHFLSTPPEADFHFAVTAFLKAIDAERG